MPVRDICKVAKHRIMKLVSFERPRSQSVICSRFWNEGTSEAHPVPPEYDLGSGSTEEPARIPDDLHETIRLDLRIDKRNSLNAERKPKSESDNRYNFLCLNPGDLRSVYLLHTGRVGRNRSKFSPGSPETENP